MFTSKGLFSQTPCPYPQQCHLPHCIFSHQTLPLTATLGSGSGDQNHSLDEDDQGGQRKRRKVAESPEKKTPARVKTDASQKDIALLARPISPPPLKRKPQQAVSVNRTAVPITQTKSADTASKPARAQIESVNRNEVLNPRTLKGPAPAAYDLRLRLARALHEHFQRLNSDLKKDASKAEEELILTDQELIGKALDIEEDAAHNPLIYTNVVKNKILTYKRMSMKQWAEERQRDVSATKAKKGINSSMPAATKLSGPAKSLDTGLAPHDELKLLPRLYTPVSGLSKHGYVSEIPSEIEIEQAKKGVEAAQGWEVCDRCKARFQVFPQRREEDGALASGGQCTYHYGKPFFQDRATDGTNEKRVKRFRCCGEAVGDSVGCTQAANHVFKISETKRQASILNFVHTPENPKRVSQGPICIDGEMGYTVFGLELIRLTATSWPSGSPIFDVLVKPLGGILDLNSRFSGVWPNDFAAALPFSSSENFQGDEKKLKMVESPQVARDLLFSHLSPEVPLIGHGLENDLNAIRVIHPTIIDTVLLYPHKAGLPFRNSLKALMALHLNRQIQVVIDGKMEGHDSKEDANAAGDLVRYKLQQEWQKMQRSGWELQNGIFNPPTSKTALGEERRRLEVPLSSPPPVVKRSTGQKDKESAK